MARRPTATHFCCSGSLSGDFTGAARVSERNVEQRRTPYPTHSAMPLMPCPGRGAVVTYLNPDALHPTAIPRGEVIGAHVTTRRANNGQPERA